jgi:epoxyqueuosine reductase
MTISISEQIHAKALELGFDVCRFANAKAPWLASARLTQFLEAGYHGEMAWMSDTAERRAHPTALWTEARSVVVLGVNYGPDLDPRSALADKSHATISVYAQGDDYHDLIKGRLKQLGGWMAGRFGGSLKVFVDTAPLMEKPLAERAGLGWQGKHTNLVSRDFGSWLFLGSVLTDLDLAIDAPESDHCGACRACLEICPTQAFPAPYQLDARRCISYLTIELKGPIPQEFRAGLGNRIYGCDDCLAVCPWNKFAQVAQEQKLQARAALQAPSLRDLAGLDDTAFRSLFTKSPVKRIGRARFLRNVLYAIGNSGDRGLVSTVEKLLTDPSPLVRGAAVWALAQLEPTNQFAERRSQAMITELEAEVRLEWDGAAP